MTTVSRFSSVRRLRNPKSRETKEEKRGRKCRTDKRRSQQKHGVLKTLPQIRKNWKIKNEKAGKIKKSQTINKITNEEVNT